MDNEDLPDIVSGEEYVSYAVSSFCLLLEYI